MSQKSEASKSALKRDKFPAAQLPKQYELIDDEVLARRYDTGMLVYIALDKKSNEQVIIKEFCYKIFELFPKMEDTFGSWEVFREEAEREYNLSRIGHDHPHIMKSLNFVVDEENKTAFMVQEYLKNAIPLSMYFTHHVKRMLRCKVIRYRERFAVELCRQIVSAVEFLHRHNVAHGDLKLANIMVCPDEPVPEVNKRKGKIASRKGMSHLYQVPFSKYWTAPCLKLIDFGSAQVADDEGAYWKHYRGTRGYAMPEVYPEDAIKPYPGKAADVWALGVITYMFVAASAPFTDGGNVNIDTIYHEKLVKNCQYVQQPSIASLHFWHFIRRIFQPDLKNRATLFELANHPFLNMSKRKLKWMEHQTKHSFEWQIPYLVKVYDVYDSIDAQSPKYRNAISETIDEDAFARFVNRYHGVLDEGKNSAREERLRTKIKAFLDLKNFDRFPNGEVALYCRTCLEVQHEKAEEIRRQSMETLDSQKSKNTGLSVFKYLKSVFKLDK